MQSASSLPFGRLRAGGRAVLHLFNLCGFSALRAEKPHTNNRLYLAAAGASLGAKRFTRQRLSIITTCELQLNLQSAILSVRSPGPRQAAGRSAGPPAALAQTAG